MNQRQKELLKRSLRSDQAVLKELEKAYAEASKTIDARIRQLMAKHPDLQSRIYQRRYQEAIKKVVDRTLERLRDGEYRTLSDYLDSCYEDGLIGTVYDMQGQGVPLIFPVDPDQMYRAVTLNSRLSSRLYTRLGQDVSKLKVAVRAEISRGIASGWMIDDIAAAIDRRQSIGLGNAKRIARTEARRIQNEAAYDAQLKAAENGAEILKEWCAILDSKTREDHRTLHGQRKKLDEYFEVNGHRALHPSGFGIPSEDINCRCVLLTRASWAVEDEGAIVRQYDQENGGVYEMKAKGFQSFKTEYFRIIDAGKEYSSFVERIGKSFDISLVKYMQMGTEDKKILSHYAAEIESERLSPLVPFSRYMDMRDEIEHRIVGITTSTGLKITGQSLHFVDRVIGSVADRRDGVSIDDCIKALTDESSTIIAARSDSSQQFRLSPVSVSINIKSGKLIQVNPWKIKDGNS